MFAVSLLLFGMIFDDVIAQTPNANAGPDQIVGFGDVVTLDGSGSTPPPGGSISYLWAQLSGPDVVLTITGQQSTFTAPNSPATLVFELTVFDNSSNVSSINEVTITVLGPQPPVADAGTNKIVAVGTTVTLDGTGSTDPNGDNITYSWTKTSGPAVSLSSNTLPMPTFTASSAGTIVFALTVSDGTLSATNTVTITVFTPTQNQPPTANAGHDRTFPPGSTVTLSGSGSDPDGNDNNLIYTWEQTSGTPKVTINDKMSARTTFTAPTDPTELVFTFTVDDRTDTTTDDITITIAKPVARNIKEMSDTLVSAKITAPNEITMTYNEELSTFINSYLNFTITGESIPRSITGINGSPSIDTGKTIFVDGERVKTYSTTLIFDGEPVSSGSTGSMYMQHADHYLAFIHVSDGQN